MPASAIYTGWVRHRRFGEHARSFRYRVFMPYLDLAELPTLLRPRWLASDRQPTLAHFRRADHLRGHGEGDLASIARDLVAARLGFLPSGPVRLLTHLGYGGFRFNPISIYYCFDATGMALEALLLEVNNTPWGEQTLYVQDCRGDDRGRHRFSHPKQLHVSPFLPMDMAYEFTVTTPDENLLVHIDDTREGRTVLDATLTLRRLAWNKKRLLIMLMRYPLMTARVYLGIHLQALRLAVRGAKIYRHPGQGEGRG